MTKQLVVPKLKTYKQRKSFHSTSNLAMIEDKEGDWVRRSDAEYLADMLQQANKCIATLESDNSALRHTRAELSREANDLEVKLEASQLAVKLPEQYPDDGELSFCIDLYDEPDMDLRLAMWLKELRRRRAGGTIQEPVKLPPSFDYEHDDLAVLIPVMEAGKVRRALRDAGITVQGDE